MVDSTSHRRREWHPTPVLLPGKSHGQRRLVGCSPWGHWGSDTTEWLHFHFSLSCIGEGNGTPPQCSCLENPRDGGAWWAAISVVAQSRTRQKWLSSSSNSHLKYLSDNTIIGVYFYQAMIMIIKLELHHMKNMKLTPCLRKQGKTVSHTMVTVREQLNT